MSDRRTELREFLAARGIESGMHHYRNDKYTLFGGRKHFPVMDSIEEKYLLLPLHMHVSVADVDRVADAIDEFKRTYA
jgi:dTDP-4-amino-4,6-dideoxygalactose transaminase